MVGNNIDYPYNGIILKIMVHVYLLIHGAKPEFLLFGDNSKL